MQIIKLLIVLFSPLPCYLVPLRPKYAPQHHIAMHPVTKFRIICVSNVGCCTCVLVLHMSIVDVTCRVLHQSGLVNKNIQTNIGRAAELFALS